MQAWVQGAIAKISSTADSVPSSAPNPISGPSTLMPISINTGTFPGTPAVRLIGDCHFLHRLCQLLHFCFFFRRTQLPQYIQKKGDSSMQKPQPISLAKVEESNSVSKPTAGSQLGSGGKGSEDGLSNRSRIGSGNAGQGYTYDEVLLLVFCHKCFNFFSMQLMLQNLEFLSMCWYYICPPC